MATRTLAREAAAAKIKSLPDTTISPMPGTDPLMLQETDKAARSALAVALDD